MVDILASFAAESSQISNANDDSVIAHVLPSSAEVLKEIELESLEMSQRIWNDVDALGGLDVNPLLPEEWENQESTDDAET